MDMPVKMLNWMRRWSRRDTRQPTAIVSHLTRFREELAAGIAPEPWPHLNAPLVLILADLCDVLGLDAQDKARVLGQTGQDAIAELLETRVTLCPTPEGRDDQD